MNFNPRLPYPPPGDDTKAVSIGWLKGFLQRFYELWRDLAVELTEIGSTTTDYTPAWTATAGAAPAIGTGTLTGKFVTRGPWRKVSIQLVADGTTTFGNAGLWNFSVPTTASRNGIGSVYMERSGVGFYIGQALITSGTSVIAIVIGGGVSTRATFNQPFAWAANDNLLIDLEYLTS